VTAEEYWWLQERRTDQLTTGRALSYYKTRCNFDRVG
jgi:hypothetical protein